jgi:hypothetical protein
MQPINFADVISTVAVARGAFSFLASDAWLPQERRTTVQFHYSRGTLRSAPEYVAPYNFYGFAGR